MISTQTIHDLTHFYVPWLTALAASALQEPAMPVAPLMISFDGLDVPVLQLVLAVAGVLMARPLAPRRDPPLGFVRSLLVTAIMVIAAVVWVADARPGVLFTFVVAIGLGFSGYSLIELAGREIEAFIKRIFAAATAAIDSITGKSK